nr:hypothetical protein [Saccharopolyspora hordei]
MQCSVLGNLAVRSWVFLPLLFLGSAGWVAALLSLALQEHPTVEQDLSLSAPLLFGSAAALTAVTAGHVHWRSRAQRRFLRTAYPLLLLACALGHDALRLPVLAVLVVGPVPVAVLATVLVRAHRDQAKCSHT